MTIDGRAADTRGSFDVLNPSTGAVHDRAPAATPEQLDEAMNSAARAFLTWRQDEQFRIAKMKELAAAVMAATPDLAGDLAAENGKPGDVGSMEGMAAAAWLGYYADLHCPVEVLRDDAGAYAEIVRKPMGVVAAITPWNSPIALAFWKIAPALRAGNTVVVKPSPFTPLSTLRVGEIARDILPPGVLNVVTGGDELGAWMTSHPIPRKVSFTGSVATGKQVAIAAGADLKRITLELGGNDPAIVLEDADVGAIAQTLFWSAFFNNGQGCCLVKRIYVPDELHDDLVEVLADVARSVSVGNPLEGEVQLGPLATRFQREKVASLVDDALGRGAKAAAGGAPIAGPGYFYEPTILTDVEDGFGIVDQEQFGPALPIVRYRTLDDVVATVNGGKFGLGASVWTSDLDRGAQVAVQLDVGTSWVNAHASLSPDAPFGGHQWSGLGVENGPWGLHGFSDIQVVHTSRASGGPGLG